MSRIHASELPPNTLLRRYDDGGSYTDCFRTEVGRGATLAAYIEAFYCSWLFRVERALLRALARIPSTDLDVERLAAGRVDRFAAWGVEARGPDQILLRAGRTRSWLMVVPLVGADARTSLYFGSAIVAKAAARTGKTGLGFGFRALLGFHTLYSRALLRAARDRLLASRSAARSAP